MIEQGRVKWFNNRTGWGFIARQRGGDVFLRHDRVRADGYVELHAGDLVEFELRKGPRGAYAEGVRPVPPPAAAPARPRSRLKAS